MDCTVLYPTPLCMRLRTEAISRHPSRVNAACHFRTLSVFPAWNESETNSTQLNSNMGISNQSGASTHLDLELGVGDVLAAIGADLVEGIGGLPAAAPSLHGFPSLTFFYLLLLLLVPQLSAASSSSSNRSREKRSEGGKNRGIPGGRGRWPAERLLGWAGQAPTADPLRTRLQLQLAGAALCCTCTDNLFF
jgi:hypothetical protein